MGQAKDRRGSSQFNSFFILSSSFFSFYNLRWVLCHSWVYAAHYEPTVEICVYITRRLRRFDMPKRFRKEHCLSVYTLSHRAYSFFTPRSRHSWFSLKSVQFLFPCTFAFTKKKNPFLPNDRAPTTRYWSLWILHYRRWSRKYFNFFVQRTQLAKQTNFWSQPCGLLKFTFFAWNTFPLPLVDTYFYINSAFPVRPGSSSSCQWRWRSQWFRNKTTHLVQIFCKIFDTFLC